MDFSRAAFEDGWTSGRRRFALWQQETRAANSEGRTDGGGDVNLRENKCVAKKKKIDMI